MLQLVRPNADTQLRHPRSLAPWQPQTLEFKLEEPARREGVMTTTYDVSSEGVTFTNTDTTTLNGAIETIDTGPVGNYVIDISRNISLTSELLAINLPTGSTLTINGA